MKIKDLEFMDRYILQGKVYIKLSEVYHVRVMTVPLSGSGARLVAVEDSVRFNPDDEVEPLKWTQT